jgi:hypothetical protein
MPKEPSGIYPTAGGAWRWACRCGFRIEEPSQAEAEHARAEHLAQATDDGLGGYFTVGAGQEHG